MSRVGLLWLAAAHLQEEAGVKNEWMETSVMAININANKVVTVYAGGMTDLPCTEFHWMKGSLNSGATSWFDQHLHSDMQISDMKNHLQHLPGWNYGLFFAFWQAVASIGHWSAASQLLRCSLLRSFAGGGENGNMLKKKQKQEKTVHV